MGGLCFFSKNNANLFGKQKCEYKDSRYTNPAHGTRRVCVRTGPGTNQIVKYGLTSNTSASKYCGFKMRMPNGSIAMLGMYSSYTSSSSASGKTTERYTYTRSSTNITINESYAVTSSKESWTQSYTHTYGPGGSLWKSTTTQYITHASTTGTMVKYRTVSSFSGSVEGVRTSTAVTGAVSQSGRKTITSTDYNNIVNTTYQTTVGNQYTVSSSTMYRTFTATTSSWLSYVTGHTSSTYSYTMLTNSVSTTAASTTSALTTAWSNITVTTNNFNL